jgi:hypothetical protein
MRSSRLFPTVLFWTLQIDADRDGKRRKPDSDLDGARRGGAGPRLIEVERDGARLGGALGALSSLERPGFLWIETDLEMVRRGGVLGASSSLMDRRIETDLEMVRWSGVLLLSGCSQLDLWMEIDLEIARLGGLLLSVAPLGGGRLDTDLDGIRLRETLGSRSVDSSFSTLTTSSNLSSSLKTFIPSAGRMSFSESDSDSSKSEESLSSSSSAWRDFVSSSRRCSSSVYTMGDGVPLLEALPIRRVWSLSRNPLEFGSEESGPGSSSVWIVITDCKWRVKLAFSSWNDPPK